MENTFSEWGRDRLLQYNYEENKDTLHEYLCNYWNNIPVMPGGRNLHTRILKWLLFEKKKDGETSVESEKEDGAFSLHFFTIIMTMRNRFPLARLLAQKEKTRETREANLPAVVGGQDKENHSKNLLRIMLRHWDDQQSDPTLKDALTNVIFRMNKINYSALIVAKIEHARRVRREQETNNTNNLFSLGLIHSAKNDWSLAKKDIQSESNHHVYLDDNKYLENSIKLQEVLCILSTGNFTLVEQRVKAYPVNGDSTTVTLNNIVIDWWMNYCKYRCQLHKCNTDKAKEHEGEMDENKNQFEEKFKSLMGENKFEKNSKGHNYIDNLTKHWGSVLENRKEDFKPSKGGATIIKKMVQLQLYIDARIKQIEIFNKDTNSRNNIWLDEDKKDWRGTHIHATQYLYETIFVDTTRKFTKSIGRPDKSPVEAIKRIKSQIDDIHEAILRIEVIGGFFAPYQMILLINDFSFRCWNDFHFLAKKKMLRTNKIQPGVAHYESIIWITKHSHLYLQEVLKRFKVATKKYDLDTRVNDVLEDCITKLEKLRHSQQKNPNAGKECEKIADLFKDIVATEKDKLILSSFLIDSPKFWTIFCVPQRNPHKSDN